MNIGPQMAKIRVDKENPILATQKSARKMPLESVKMKNYKICIIVSHHALVYSMFLNFKIKK